MKIENLEEKQPNLDDDQTKKEILELVAQKRQVDCHWDFFPS